jgi:PBSX family phage terminase large subunit
MTSADAIAQQLYRRLKSAPMPAVYDKQEEFVMTAAHHAAFIAGIGSGKSFAGAVRALRAALGWVGTARIKTPNLGVITAPTYDMLRDATLRTFREIAEKQVKDINKNEMLITLHNGSEVIFRSTQHPDRLRGPSISWWWGDEAALYTPDVRKIMVGRLRQFGALGYDWVTTTPRGRNWVYQTFVQDVPAKLAEDYLVVRARSRENVFMQPDVIEMWESEYVGDFARQELEGEFVAFEGLVYNEFSSDLHVVNQPADRYPRVVAGVDWGFANPGVMLVCGVDSDGRMTVVDEVYRRQTRIEEWAEIGRQMRRRWNISQFYCDPASPDNIRVLREAGLPAEEANNTVQTGIQRVKARLARQADGMPRLLISRSAVNLMAEFGSYQWATNRHGMRDEPVKAKDHAMDALRYAVMGVDEPKARKVEAKAQRYA